jgi:signal transduction histidine kinase
MTVDVTVALVAALLGAGLTVLGESWRPSATAFVLTIDWVGILFQIALAVPLLVRRRLPLTVAALMLATAVCLVAVVVLDHRVPAAQGTTLLVPMAAPFATYSAAVYSPHRWRSWAITAALTLVAGRTWERSPSVVLAAVLFIAVPALLGMYVAARRRLIQALVDRAERAERERYLEAEQARADERARLAGEMHDVVTHRVSLMVLQAGALRVTATDEQVRQAAEELRAAGVQALDELRDLVGILRAPPATGEGSPGSPAQTLTAGLEQLVAESESVGVAVELIQEGSPAQVSPVVGRTAYRVVQEALTNVRKHAPGARVRVRVRYGSDGLHVSVRNTVAAAGADVALTRSGSGSGLRSLRERLALVGGSLRVASCADGGFEVQAVLPGYVPAPEGVP